MIPYGRQEITQSDIDAVVNVLSSDFLTQGPQVPNFEKIVANYVGSKYAIAVNSATSALHLACLALDLSPGDLLWTTPISFVASANCGIYCGANIDFVDIDPKTYNISPYLLEKKLMESSKKGQIPKILVVVHLAGQSCEMHPIRELSKQYGFKIIEDASHAIGGKYRGEFIGNCKFSDITVFSFHPVKIITTAEGGMALTNSKELANKIMLLRSHGITRDEIQMTHSSHGPWYYEQIELGFNYRMNDLQAALGISQMDRLNEYITRRHQLANIYNQMLKDLPLSIPWQHPETHSSLHLYIIRLNLNVLKRTRLEIFKDLLNKKIGVNLHYIPIHLHPYYQSLGFRKGDYINAEKYYAEAITLPLYPLMKEDQQHQVIDALRTTLKN